MQKSTSFLGSILSKLPKTTTPITGLHSVSGFLQQQKFILPTQDNIIEEAEDDVESTEQQQQPKYELTAVPKKRVSYTRNRKRNSSKKYELIHHHTICTKCHSVKLRHHLCYVCLRDINSK
eukprot:gene10831-13275_t